SQSRRGAGAGQRRASRTARQLGGMPMNPLIYALLAMIGLGAASMAFVPSLLGASRAEKRRRSFHGDVQANRRENNAAQAREAPRRNIQQTLKQQTAELSRRRRNLTLRDRIFQAALKITPRDFIRNQVTVGVVIAVVCFLL